MRLDSMHSIGVLQLSSPSALHLRSLVSLLVGLIQAHCNANHDHWGSMLCSMQPSAAKSALELQLRHWLYSVCSFACSNQADVWLVHVATAAVCAYLLLNTTIAG
jgi:hypothetical protein